MDNGTGEVLAHTTATTTVPATVKIHMLDRQKPMSWWLMPEFLDRVKEFCLKEDTDSDATLLTETIMRDFVAEQHVFALMVGIAESRVCGHLLASIDRWYEKRFCTVLQYKWDKGLGVSRGLIQAGFDSLSDWANLNQCVEIQALVPDLRHVRRLKMLYGFRPHKTLMRKEI